MATQRICPYYLVTNEDEEARVRKALFGYKVERLHDYPFIIGREPGFTFQAKGSDHPMPTHIGSLGEPDLVYRHTEVPES